jgi:hypothetical protein
MAGFSELSPATGSNDRKLMNVELSSDVHSSRLRLLVAVVVARNLRTDRQAYVTHNQTQATYVDLGRQSAALFGNFTARQSVQSSEGALLSDVFKASFALASYNGG